MIALISKCIRKLFIPGAFFFSVSITATIHSMEVKILLSPPGVRPIRDLSLVIPADFNYSNRSIKLPAYCGVSGNPANGWSTKFVDTRRFASDQRTWIFFRNSDLRRSVLRRGEGDQEALRF